MADRSRSLEFMEDSFVTKRLQQLRQTRNNLTREFLMKSEHDRSDPAEPEHLRTLRLIGAIGALLAVLGIAILVFWFLIRAPRF